MNDKLNLMQEKMLRATELKGIIDKLSLIEPSQHEIRYKNGGLFSGVPRMLEIELINDGRNAVLSRLTDELNHILAMFNPPDQKFPQPGLKGARADDVCECPMPSGVTAENGGPARCVDCGKIHPSMYGG